MVAILKDLILKLCFLCTPMSLESVEDFNERMKEMEPEEVEKQMKKMTETVMGVLKDKEAIPSTLPRSLFDAWNTSYIRHLSPLIGLFGCQSHRQEWGAYNEAYEKYSEEVKQSLSEKVASVLEDATDNEDLKMINDHLIIKWDWLNNGILDGKTWGSSTRIPLLTQTVIKNLDAMIDDIAPSFEEVRKFKPV